MEKESFAVLAIVGVIVYAAFVYFDEQKKKEERRHPRIVVCPDGKCPAVLVEKLADIPPELRERNWAPEGYGSCVHASTVTLLRWQGQYALAEWWRNTYHSGEYSERLIQRLHAAGLRYAYTNTGDILFLEWACRNRLAAGIFYYPSHAVNIVELNEHEAVLIDNNYPDRYIRIPRDEFIRDWQEKYGGFAWTIVYRAPPPTPNW